MNIPSDNALPHDCLILCGGLGTRLKGVVDQVPKVMAEVDGRPFLDYILQFLKGQGIQRVVLCAGYKAETIKECYQEGFKGIEIIFSVESEPLGTGGAIKEACSLIQSDAFIVLNGDSFCPVDLEKLSLFHNQKNALATIVVAPVKNANDFGGIALNEEDAIVSFKEKELSVDEEKERLVNAGVYCFDKNILTMMPQDNKFSLEVDCFQHWIGKKFYGFKTEQEFLDIGTPERYDLAKQWMSVFKEG